MNLQAVTVEGGIVQSTGAASKRSSILPLETSAKVHDRALPLRGTAGFRASGQAGAIQLEEVQRR